MHPETQLQVARFEHRQRVAEATRLVSVLRALIAQREQRRTTHERAKQEPRLSGAPAGACPCQAEPVPRWAV
ncbi:MAG: hypothetical protein GX593_08525 [Actinomycetales bacterium]|nr:hypothetical protein [Actinomycetales bacterium]